MKTTLLRILRRNYLIKYIPEFNLPYVILDKKLKIKIYDNYTLRGSIETIIKKEFGNYGYDIIRNNVKNNQKRKAKAEFIKLMKL